MRPLLHVIAFVLMLPSLLLASGFVLLGRAITGATLWEFIDRLANEALWLLSWGIYAALTLLVAILIGGFFAHTRRSAASAVAVLAVVSCLLVVDLQSGPVGSGQWLFLLPGFVSAMIGGWLAARDKGGQRHLADDPLGQTTESIRKTEL